MSFGRRGENLHGLGVSAVDQIPVGMGDNDGMVTMIAHYFASRAAARSSSIYRMTSGEQATVEIERTEWAA
jgi:hypothetical protein